MNAASYRSRKERHPRTTEAAYPPIFDLFSVSGIAVARWLARSAFDPKGSSPYTAGRPPELPASPDKVIPFQVTQNDIVVLAGNQGTWKVVARVNGTKADIRRRATFDTRIVTVPVKNLRVIRRAGSPGCDY